MGNIIIRVTPRPERSPTGTKIREDFSYVMNRKIEVKPSRGALQKKKKYGGAALGHGVST